MEGRGIAAQIHSHPLGHQEHGVGATVDFRAADGCRFLRPRQERFYRIPAGDATE